MQVVVAQRADWSSIPPQLLSRIFETQSNALDNCAAACTCVQWRRAVSESHIDYLHLHADSPTYNSNWRSFFRSRRSIAALKLTSDVRQLCSTWAPLLAKSVEQGCCLKQIPLGCSALSADPGFLGVPGCINHLVDLQQIHFAFKAETCALNSEPLVGQNEHAPLPDLSFLYHLKKLELYQEGQDTLKSDHVFVPSKLPLVEHLVLSGVECSLYTLNTNFTALTSLELIGCILNESHRFKIGGLRKLRIEECQLENDGQCIIGYTQLTFLCLTESTWLEGLYCVEALKTFYGWPCLRVLQCAGCNLFDRETDFKPGPVVQLQVDGFVPGTECAELCIDNRLAHPGDIDVVIGNALWAGCLVSLHLEFDYHLYLPSDGFAVLASDMCSWLEACPQLQVLSLSAPSIDDTYPVPGVFAPSSTHMPCLQEVHLHHLPLGVIDLEKACRLSVLQLSLESSNGLCKLCLPSSLQHFEFKGSFLFVGHGRLAMCDCSMMTKLVLSPYGLAQSACKEYWLPILPGSLVHLAFNWEVSSLTTLLKSPSLTCLQACTNLEQLTLPRRYYQSGVLKEFGTNARHLHVLEYR